MIHTARHSMRHPAPHARVAHAVCVTLGATLCTLALVCVGCTTSGHDTEAAVSATQSFTAMDTGMTLTINAPDQMAADDAAQACKARIQELDELLSPAGEQSQVAFLNGDESEGGIAFFCDDLQPLFETALAVANETNGAFDPTVYPLTSAWGFTSGNHRVPSADELAALLPLVGYNRIHLDTATGAITHERGTQVDFGGVAKGFAADELRELLSQRAVTSALLDLGGNVTALGSKPDGTPWKVGVANPAAPDQLAGTLQLENVTASTSGTYQRFFVDEQGNRWHHLIDPATGYPADAGLASVTVVGAQAARCDALSTALYVMGLDGALAFWRSAAEPFEAVLITNDGAVYVTAGLAASFVASTDFADQVQVVQR